MSITELQVRSKLANDDAFVVNCLIELYSRQTPDEQAVGGTMVGNGMGFNALDAGFLSSCAQQAIANRSKRQSGGRAYDRDLSPAQLTHVRRGLEKYAGQLTVLVNERMEEKALAPAEHAAIAECVASQKRHNDEELEFRDHIRAKSGLSPWRGNTIEKADRAAVTPVRAAVTEAAQRDVEGRWNDAQEFLRAPSCVPIQAGGSIRFPTAKELWNNGGREHFLASIDKAMVMAGQTEVANDPFVFA